MIDFSKIRTLPIAKRKNKFSIENLIPINKKFDFRNDQLVELAKKIIQAHGTKKKIIVMMGAHVIKVGCSLFIIELMKKGVISHIAMNGAGSIHDFEIAFIGGTSEDVGTNIKDGTFGMAEETGTLVNEAIIEGAKKNIGYGKAIGAKISYLDLKFKDKSIFYHGFQLGVPITVHAAIGTDIIYQHPACDGAAIGQTSYYDFKIFAQSITELEGGVLLNIGSAVILPEVFLKALTVVRNLGYKVEHFTTANLDMIKHYRPTENVVNRPTSLGGKGYQIIERHEKTIPTLYHRIMKGIR